MPERSSRRLTIYGETEERVNQLIRQYHNDAEGPMFQSDTLTEVPFDRRVRMVLDALEGEIERLRQEQHTTGGTDAQQVGQLLPDLPDELGR